jgi:hypothetical protein
VEEVAAGIETVDFGKLILGVAEERLAVVDAGVDVEVTDGVIVAWAKSVGYTVVYSVIRTISMFALVSQTSVWLYWAVSCLVRVDFRVVGHLLYRILVRYWWRMRD